MSVIIRLQNLPLSAKSSDIRHFFRGLRIPDGGVHIVGGDKGDAFIAFNSDEDARIAISMKDRGRIKGSKIKLLLSSYMEMQHAIERITKYESSRQSSPYGRGRSSERSRQQKNEKYRSYSPREDRYIRSHSPRRSRSPSSRRSRSPYERSWSSRSRRSPSSRQRSPNSRDLSPLGHTRDSYADSYTSDSKRSYHDFEKRGRDAKHDEHSRNVKNFRDSQKSPTTSDEQRQLEERIAKALNTGFVENAFGISSNGDKSITNMQIPQPQVEPYIKPMQPFGEGFFNPIPDHSMMMANQQPVAEMSNSNFIPGLVHMNPMAGIPQSNDIQSFAPPPYFPGPNLDFQTAVPSPAGQKPFIPFTGYYITISGLDTLWTNSDLQTMLKGIFAPQDNIRWEVDDSGFKTGTAFIKLMNKEDFNQILAQPTYVFNNKMITVSECPNSVYEKYFPPPSVPPLPGQAIIQDGELYYKIKGLPYTITHEEIMHFFYGFQIADVYLESLPSGKMTGEGFICFTNIADYERARLMHGKKLGLAFIEMTPCSRQEMMDAKRRNNAFFNSNLYPPPAPAVFEKPPGPKRPLCALLTGLPFFIKISKIETFFQEHGGLRPDAIHLLTKYKGKPTGRGFVEFSNIRDFDAALKLHGSKIGESMICVKQILYDEMTKILSTHKAKHGYADKTSPNLVPVPNLPYKPPHIWDPPDYHNSNFISLQNSSNDFFPDSHRNVPSSHSDFPHTYEKNNFKMDHNKNKDYPAKRNRNDEKRFQSSNRNRNEEKRFHSPAIESRNDEERFQSDLDEDYPRSETNDPYLNKEKDDPLRIPVKLEVKIKQSVAKNTEADEVFDRSLKNDTTIKLSKLTPEKEIEIVKVISNKTVKEVRIKDTEIEERRRSESPPPYRKRNNFDKKNSSPPRRDERRKPERYSPDKYDSDYPSPGERYVPHHQPRSRSPPRKAYYKKNYKGKYIEDDIFGEVVVEMCNVHPHVGSLDLLDFFQGYDVTEDRMIRRYSDIGEPLGDIRVTFLSLREAEKAVKYLNGQYLNGIPVSLFIVD